MMESMEGEHARDKTVSVKLSEIGGLTCLGKALCVLSCDVCLKDTFGDVRDNVRLNGIGCDRSRYCLNIASIGVSGLLKTHILHYRIA